MLNPLQESRKELRGGLDWLYQWQKGRLMASPRTRKTFARTPLPPRESTVHVCIPPSNILIHLHTAASILFTAAFIKYGCPTRYWRTHENKMGTMKYKISQNLALGELWPLTCSNKYFPFNHLLPGKLSLKALHYILSNESILNCKFHIIKSWRSKRMTYLLVKAIQSW